jgi:hypothetical protein
MLMSNFQRIFFWMVLFVLSACGGSSQDDSALVAQVSAPGAGSFLVVKLTDTSGTVVANNTVGLNAAGFMVQGQVRDASSQPVPNQLVTFTTDPNFGSFVNGTTTVVTSTTTGTVTVSRITGLTDATGIVRVQLVGKSLGAAFLQAETKVGTTSVITGFAYQVASVTAGIASGLRFDSATPSRLFVSSASNGVKQSIVKFRVVNELGTGVIGQAVMLSLNSQSIIAGVTFIKDGISSSSPQVVVSGLDGLTQIVVNAGGLPTGAVVNAVLVANPVVKASSDTLSVSSGRVTPDTMSISAYSPIVEGFNLDNVSTELTVIVADRLGNPIPEGTVVNFVTSHGLIGTFVNATTTTIVTNTPTGTATTVTTSVITDARGSCTVSAASLCRVLLKSAGVRPTNGKVTVLAYTDGEENYKDLNGNNLWDIGEPFTDMGMAYLDSNGNFVYDLGVDQAIPGGKTGSVACVGTDLSVQNTCDGTWSDYMRARKRITIIWATSRARIKLIDRTSNSMTVTVLDLNGNGMPSGTTVTAEVGDNSACRVRRVVGSSDPDTPGLYTISLNGDVSCLTAEIDVTVTSPSGIQTFQAFN